MKSEFWGDFEIQTDRRIQASRQDLVLINKKTRNYLLVFAVPVDYRMKIKESEKKPWPCQRAEKAIEHKGDSDTSRSCWNR